MNIDESTQIHSVGEYQKISSLKQHIMDLLEGLGLAHLRCIIFEFWDRLVKMEQGEQRCYLVLA